jgi:hypothetical protein
VIGRQIELLRSTLRAEPFGAVAYGRANGIQLQPEESGTHGWSHHLVLTFGITATYLPIVWGRPTACGGLSDRQVSEAWDAAAARAAAPHADAEVRHRIYETKYLVNASLRR